MSWIKLSQYLPGNEREIQIWNNRPKHEHGVKGNVVGRYNPHNGIWKSTFNEELNHVTHWAELLPQPEDLNQ